MVHTWQRQRPSPPKTPTMAPPTRGGCSCSPPPDPPAERPPSSPDGPASPCRRSCCRRRHSRCRRHRRCPTRLRRHQPQNQHRRQHQTCGYRCRRCHDGLVLSTDQGQQQQGGLPGAAAATVPTNLINKQTVTLLSPFFSLFSFARLTAKQGHLSCSCPRHVVTHPQTVRERNPGFHWNFRRMFSVTCHTTTNNNNTSP